MSDHLLAADLGNSLFGGTHFLTQATGLGTLVSLFLSNSIIIAGIILLFIIAYTGFLFVSAGGNPQKVQASMKFLTYGIIGFLLVFGTYFIIRLIESMTGVPILG